MTTRDREPRITIERGSTRAYACSIQVGGVPLDITGHTITAQARVAATRALAGSATITITDASAGEFTLRFPAAVTEMWTPGVPLVWIVDEARADSVRLVREGLWRTCTWERFAERYDSEPPSRST